MSYTKVKHVYEDRWPEVKAYLDFAGVNSAQYEVFIRGFKFEEDLELWAKDSTMDSFRLIKTYKWCTNVGVLGPKRKEGDKQIPEGVYYMSQFNPESAFHLSLKVSYPNKSDSILGYYPRLGGMIYIHGGCKSIGCIPIDDPNIEELYLFCMKARSSGQKNIPIHLFPARLNEGNFLLLQSQFSDLKLVQFWSDLKEGYDIFEKTRSIPKTRIDNGGRYHFSEN